MTETAAHLLSGLALCGQAGCGLHVGAGSATQPGGWIYRCPTRGHVARRGEQIDDLVSSIVVARLSFPDAAPLVADFPDAQLAWDEMDIDGRRAVIDVLMTVTLLPVPVGQDTLGFDPESVAIEPKVARSREGSRSSTC